MQRGVSYAKKHFTSTPLTDVHGDDVTSRPRVFERRERFGEGRKEEVDDLMLIVFFDMKGVITTERAPQGRTVNQHLIRY